MSENVIDSLVIEIEANSKDSSKALKELTNSLKSLGKTNNSIEKCTDNLSKLSKVLKNFSVAQDKLKLLTRLGSSLANISGRGLNTAAKNVTALGVAVNGLDISRIKSFADALNGLGVSTQQTADNMRAITEAAKKFNTKPITASATGSGTPTGVQSGSGIAEGEIADAKLSEQTKETNKLSKALKKLFGAVAKVSGKIGHFAKGLLGLRRVTDKFGKSISKSAKKVASFPRALGRIALYRALRVAVSSIAKAFKEGTNNAYEWSKTVGDRALANALNMCSTAVLYLKNSLGALVSPIIEKVAPAIDYAVDKFVDFLNIINQVIAALTGKSTWTKASKVPKEYADATKKAVKEQKNWIAGFDELNVISAPNSGGANSNAIDYSSMFTTEDIASGISDWSANIKNLASQGDWYGVGKEIGTKINEGIVNFDAEGFMKKLASKIQNAVNTYNGVMETVDFKTLASKIGTAINSLFENVSPKSIGEAIANTLNAGIDSLSGLMETIDFKGIGKWLAEALNGLIKKVDAKELGKSIGELISGAFALLGEFLMNVDYEALVNDIVDFFKGLFDGINLGDIAGAIGAFIGAALALGLSLIKVIALDPIWDAMKAGWDLIKEPLFEVGAKVKEKAEDLWNGLKSGWNSIKDKTLEVGAKIKEKAENLWNGIKNGWNGLKEKTVEIGSKLKENATSLWNGIKNGWAAGKEKAVEIKSKLSKGASDLWGGVKDGWKNLKNKTVTVTSKLSEGASSLWNGVKNGWSTGKAKVVEITSKLSQGASGLWENVKTGWSNLKDTSLNIVLGLGTKISELWNGIKEGFAKYKLNFHVEYVTQGLGPIKSAIVSALGLQGWPSLQFFKNGGFIEDGLFTMNKGEIAGKFDNGRSVVANNEQIVEGIKRGVYEAMMSAQGGEQIVVTLNVDGDVMARKVFDAHNRQVKMTGTSPLYI